MHLLKISLTILLGVLLLVKVNVNWQQLQKFHHSDYHSSTIHLLFSTEQCEQIE
jgi:hypothetical protein